MNQIDTTFHLEAYNLHPLIFYLLVDNNKPHQTDASGAVTDIKVMEDGWSYYNGEWYYYYNNGCAYYGWVDDYYVNIGIMYRILL